LFVDAVLRMARSGAPWRDLPEEFGRWNSAYKRFARWEKRGVWHRIFAQLAGDSDFEEVFIDSTVIRAHQHAAGARKVAGAQAIGRSRGGLTTKVHALVESLGKLARWRLRSCLETVVSSQAVSHQSDHRQMNPGFAGWHQTFVVLAEAT
jgi:transposase